MIVAISLTRMMVILNITPFTSSSVISGIGRNAVILSLTLILFPLFLPPEEFSFNVLELTALLVKEGVLGALIGFYSSYALWIGESVGFFIDNQRGATLASVFNPLIGQTTSPLGNGLNVIFTAFFYVIGGFVSFLAIVYASYVTWPMFSFYPTFDGRFPLFVLASGDHLLRSIVLYSAPVVFIMFLSDFCLGLINRFAPQLQVFFLSLPLKSGIGMLILIIYMGTLFALIKTEFNDSLIIIKYLHTLLS